jgi:predicted NAD-dependent protein-ADP-ribosyltransferase YbiA (DUF1768 family)
MELRRAEHEGLTGLAGLWKTTPGAELEAMIMDLDLTGWQDIIQYLRSLGMRENQQIVRLNICLSNDIRFTLEGAGVVQAFCRDNKIHNKPYTAMLKENITDAVPVEFESYSARAKLKREVPLAADDMRVKDALSRWDQLAKLYRQIQRFEFVAPGGLGIRFDVSLVREGRGRTYQESRITMAASKYEAEVELTADRSATERAQATSLILKGLGWLLQGRQRSYVLSTAATVEAVQGAIGEIFQGGSGATGATVAGGAAGGNQRNRNRRTPAMAGGPFRYPGPQPATLERKNMVTPQEPGVPNLLTTPGGYNVTDKADGLRCMLYVAKTGKIYLVDGGGRVYSTGKQVTGSGAVGVVLDGEWIQRTRRGEVVSHFYAFDILAGPGGDVAVTGLPFLVAGAMAGTAAAENTRQAAMASAITALAEAKQTVKGVPASADLQIGMKNFRTVTTASNMFRDAVSATMEDMKSAAYNTDGLIFTPNTAPLPLGRRSWPEQMKWKPAHENTIDFLVVVDKERDARGVPTAVDAIGTKYREDAGHTVRFKTLRLFVGSSRDAAYADPRSTVLGDGPLPLSTEEGAWRPVEFRPTAPRDPMASVCYMAIGEGAGDPAGATTAATAIDTDSTTIRTTRTGDVIQSDMIVEMAYHPERAPGWRWEPVRVRHDKTERWRGGSQSGTMNADWVANGIWSTLHNPITEEAIRTGKITECVAPAAIVAPAVAGTGRRAPARDLMKVQCMWNFHDDGIKRAMLLHPTLGAKPGSTLCDLAMGRAADLHKWVAEGVSYVFGCDVAAANLNDPEDGAYRRLLDKMVSMGGRDKVPPMTFVQADAARRLSTGEAGITPEDQRLLAREFGTGGQGAGGYDVTSCMFALHYMFRDENTLAGFLTNLADTVKVGGYFVGCCADGDAMAKMLYGHTSVAGRDGATDVWVATKRYGSAIGSSVPPSAVGLGLAVDMDFLSIGETHTEYLISWPYLQQMLATAGLELLTASECTELGLPTSTQMFGETWAASGARWEMSEAIKRLSFLNRWFVFKRRSDARPAPPREPVAPVATEALTAAITEKPVEMAEGGVSESKSSEPEEEAAAPVVAIPQLDVIELPEVAAPAPAPENKQYIVSLGNKEPDMRLGDAYTDWPRYLATGMLSELTDRANPAIKYPSIDAAIAAAKYQVATNKPEFGPAFFKVDGAIHQKFERLRLAATSKEEIDKSIDDELTAIRTTASATGIAKVKGTWNKDAWDSQKGEVYQAYLLQRYQKDARYRAMIDAIRARGGEILIENGTEYNELGVGVRADGSVVGGDNRIGRWMMTLGS